MKPYWLYADSWGKSGATTLHEDLQAEVLEAPKPKGAVDNPTNGTIDAFDKALGHSVNKVGGYAHLWGDNLGC